MHALQVSANLGGTLVAQLAIFFEGFVDNLFELRRQLWIQPHRCHRYAVEDRFRKHAQSVAPKGQNPTHHFIEHDAKRKQVGTSIQILTPHLLRRHVCQGADRRSRSGQIGHLTRLGDRGRRGIDNFKQLGQSEIEDLDVSSMGDEDVRGFNVAVDDAFAVSCVESVGDLDAQTE